MSKVVTKPGDFAERRISQIISFLQKISTLSILLICISCAQLDFNEVITGVLIPKGENIVYNNESIIEVNGNTIFIKKSEKYNQDLDLLEVDISKAESMLTYSRKELEEDKPLIHSYKITLNRENTLIKNNFLIDNKKKYDIAYQTKDTILGILKNHVLILTK